jgi:hypothetical protein
MVIPGKAGDSLYAGKTLFCWPRLKALVQSATCKSFLLATRKQVDVLFERHLVFNLIFRQLIFDVLSYCFVVLSRRVYIITSIPKCLFPYLYFKFACRTNVNRVLFLL